MAAAPTAPAAVSTIARAALPRCLEKMLIDAPSGAGQDCSTC
jgi:hypothetical protein